MYNLEQAALIILEETGIIYYNQTGGNFCLHSEAEGILVPISNNPPLADLYHGSLGYKLSMATLNTPWLTEADAIAVEIVLREGISKEIILVNRQLLSKSNEAWVHVIIRKESSDDLKDFASCKAILTWPNSD